MNKTQKQKFGKIKCINDQTEKKSLNVLTFKLIRNPANVKY